MKIVSAAEFKASCLALMDRVHEPGEFLVITKHGKPVAKLVPAERECSNMWGDLAGTVKILEISSRRRRLAGMVIVLDTHVLVWLRTCPDQLAKGPADAIRKEPRSDCVSIAAVTLWELSWLAANGRIGPGATVPVFLKTITAGGVILPWTVEIAPRIPLIG